MALGWSGKNAKNTLNPKTCIIQESNCLQKVETSVKLPPDYQNLPGEEPKLFHLDRSNLIQTKPSLKDLMEKVT